MYSPLRSLFIGILFAFCVFASAQTMLTVSDKQNWTKSELSPYVGQTVQMADDWYICSNNGVYTIAPRRIFSPTNQTLPLSAEYNRLLALNSTGAVVLDGVSGYHRTGERLRNLVVTVNSIGSLTFKSGQWVGNSRNDLLQGYSRSDIDRKGSHTLLVCAANLRYYLVENLGTGYGPYNHSEHQAQRKKVSQALAKINADIYGLVEIEMGQSALQEIASDLTQLTGRTFSYIDDGLPSNGSYTKSGYVYCVQTVNPYGKLHTVNTGVHNRKQFQGFEQRASGEHFVLSINHFKAKSGNGSGDNADQGDGQGSFNADRLREAKAVLNGYEYYRDLIMDQDVLIMGDLNAYAKEDPIRALTDYGMTDLHRYFHVDSSYSYTYGSEAGYLDHALCSGTMLPQVTGMCAYHVNSDERDVYAYNRSSNDGTMFRYSDHDPILVGLRLSATASSEADIVCDPDMLFKDGYLSVEKATGGYLRVYDQQGRPVWENTILTDTFTLPISQWQSGVYVVHLYVDGKVLHRKILVL
ncbi:MAG: T9SS type A sorting domain-containing protein [Paludibacteraceae bacterium]|nr:T9SS type A sorting domain-containing protein [Paludibacteraceae bacterium]